MTSPSRSKSASVLARLPRREPPERAPRPARVEPPPPVSPDPLALLVPAVRTKHHACDTAAEVEEAVNAEREDRAVRSLRSNVPTWDPRPLAVGPLLEACAERFDRDLCLHFARVHLGGDAYFHGRLGKKLAGTELPLGWTVEVTGCGLDLDNAAHAHWSDPDDMHARVADLCARFEVNGGALPDPAIVYPTPGGIRALYVFAEPLTPFEAQSVIGALHELYDREGFPNDSSVCQWNRLHRLPLIRRKRSTPEGEE